MNEMIGQIIAEIISLTVALFCFHGTLMKDFETRIHPAAFALSSFLLSFISASLHYIFSEPCLN
jgi:hypothetical protein